MLLLLPSNLKLSPKSRIQIKRKPIKNHQKIATKIVKNTTFYSLEQEPHSVLPETVPFEHFDSKSLSLLLKNCTCINEVKRLHAIATRALKSSVAYVVNNLINEYLRFSCLDYANKLFDEMTDKNVVTWTTIINGHRKLGLENEAVKFFVQMIENDIEANCLTYVCLLKSCGNSLNYELGKQIHACVLKGGWSNLIVESTLIYFYGQCGDLLSSRHVFDSMQNQDIISWTTLITSYAQQGHSDEALLSFSKMQHCGLMPNEYTLCSILKACGEEKALRFGRQLHGCTVKGMFKNDVVVGSSLIAMYVKCGEVSDARLIFDQMEVRNTVTWTSMISGYARNGEGEEAIRLFHRMNRLRVSANHQTIVSIISACGSIRALNLGKEVHGQVVKKLAQRNTYIDSTLIWLYCRCNKYSYAARILETMHERDTISWTAMISGHNALDDTSESLKFLNEMLWEGITPTPHTYSSALKACAKNEEVRYGKWIHGSAKKSRAVSNVYVGSALTDMYMRCGCIEDAYRVFKSMPVRNLVSWKAMIVGYAKNGHCRQAMKLMYDMKAEGYYVDEFIISTVLGTCGDLQWEMDGSTVVSSLAR